MNTSLFSKLPDILPFASDTESRNSPSSPLSPSLPSSPTSHSDKIPVMSDTLSQTNAPEPANGKPRPGEISDEALRTDTGEIAPEVRKAQEGEDMSDEEYKKIEVRLGNIIDTGLKTVQPLLKIITDGCEKAEQQQKNDELNEDAFVDKMKPLINEATSVLQSTLNMIEALDPEKKIQNRAKRSSEDQKATPEQKKIADGLAKLTEEVTKCIENAKKKIENMPKAKRELGPLFNMLSKPLFQILSAVGLLVVGVLNLVGNILDALGLGGIIGGLTKSLGLNNLMNMLGWKLTLTKTDDQKK